MASGKLPDKEKAKARCLIDTMGARFCQFSPPFPDERLCVSRNRTLGMPVSRAPANDFSSISVLRRNLPLTRRSLLPQLPSPCLDRSDLVSRLLNDDARVRLLIAPSGFGKTTLLLRAYQLARADGRAAGWVSVQAHHREPEHLLRAIASSFGLEDPNDDCEVLMEHLHSKQRAILLIDHLENLRGAASISTLEKLFQELRHCHIVAAGQTRCGLKMSRLTLAGRAEEHGSETLAFTTLEVRSLAQSLSDEEATQLVSVMEGWPIGVCAAVKEMGPKRRLTHLDGASIPSMLERYFEENVLDALSAAERDALTDLAVFTRFNAMLFAGLPQASSPVEFNKLMERDLPVESLGDPPGWYRFLKPFRTFLLRRLRHRSSAREHELHVFAAEWFERAGHSVESIRHAGLCGDSQTAARIFERANLFKLSLQKGLPLLQASEAGRPGAGASSPTLMLGQVLLKSQDGRIEEARAALNQLREGLPALSLKLSAESVNELRNYSDILDFNLRIYEDRPIELPQIEALEQLVARASEKDPLIFPAAMCALAAAYFGIGRIETSTHIADLGMAALRATPGVLTHFYLEIYQTLSALGLGRVREAALHVDRSIEPARLAFGENNLGAGLIEVLKGVVLCERNELVEAQKFLKRALDREAIANCWFDMYAEQLSAATDTACALEGVEAAYSVLTAAEVVAARRRLPRLTMLVALLRLRSASTSGNLPYAMHIMQSDEVASLAAPMAAPASLWSLKLRTLALLESARILGLVGRPHDAINRLARIDQNYLELGDARTRFLYQMLAMELTFQIHRNTEAADHFIKGTNLALDAGFTRRLLCHRRQVLAVFDWISGTGRAVSARTAEYCSTALRQAEPSDSQSDLQRRLIPRTKVGRLQGVMLSEREAQILEMVAEGLSTKEIASGLSVSVSTVKTHRRHIFEKLGVTRRSQAIASARQLMIVR